ncbi:hypothetical protein POVCU1_043760 [Plasmodium ovale curtisi]|uniref:Uncharacterized protein n=1 Tax=Plasmodium ovale curtisi TaxID=864141 RepID=A0A1A8WYT0_PLAOA|nr:hypothetical protein POVCU1_043760 [Plasmodium ovale curtisi]
MQALRIRAHTSRYDTFDLQSVNNASNELILIDKMGKKKKKKKNREMEKERGIPHVDKTGTLCQLVIAQIRHILLEKNVVKKDDLSRSSL